MKNSKELHMWATEVLSMLQQQGQYADMIKMHPSLSEDLLGSLTVIFTYDSESGSWTSPYTFCDYLNDSRSDLESIHIDKGVVRLKFMR